MITNRIKQWLGITDITKRQRDVEHRIEHLNNILQSCSRIGIDQHYKDNSWAVICIGGKSEYVGFYSLGRNGEKTDLKYLLDLLKSMKISDVLIDCNPHVRRELRKWF